MGGNFSAHPLQEQQWSSYYGPIRETEAADALDAAITSRLHDTGNSPSISVRKQTAENISVPVGLRTPAFTEENGALIVHFAAGMPGKVTITSDPQKLASNFSENLDGQFKIDLIDKSRPATLTFDFDVTHGVSSRIYELKFHGKIVPTVIRDKIICDGVEFIISKIYRGQETESSCNQDFSDGMCLICCSEPSTVISYPCRHCCMCRECSEQFVCVSNRCPVCRTTVLEMIDYQPFEVP